MHIATSLLISFIFSINIWKFSSSLPFEVTDFYCTKQNKTICADNLCRLRKVRRGISLIDFYCYFEIPITSFTVNVILFKKERNVYKRWFVNFEDDLCKLLAGTAYSSVFSKMIDSTAKYANFIHPCPFIGNFSAYNYPLDLSFIPTVLQKGQFRLSGTVKSAHDKTTYLIGHVHFTLK